MTRRRGKRTPTQLRLLTDRRTTLRIPAGATFIVDVGFCQYRRSAIRQCTFRYLTPEGAFPGQSTRHLPLRLPSSLLLTRPQGFLPSEPRSSHQPHSQPFTRLTSEPRPEYSPKALPPRTLKPLPATLPTLSPRSLCSARASMKPCDLTSRHPPSSP